MKNNTSEKLKKAIDASRSILLHCHPNPDPDSIGSVLAMREVLTNMGKKVTAIRGDSKFSENMGCFNQINLIEEKTYFDLDITKFDLFIILDTGSISQISKLGKVEFPKTLNTIVIDHHATNEFFGKLNYVESDRISTCEILYELFKLWKIDISYQMAVNLFLGLYSDSGGFSYPSTNCHTFLVASELVSKAPDFDKYIFDLLNGYSEKQIEYLGLALSSIEKYYGGKVAISAISYETLKKHHINEEDTKNVEVANILKSVKGWELGISMDELEPGKVGVSLRTRDSNKYDVSVIAKSIGGGGHKAASGASINEPLTKAKEVLISTIANLYPELVGN